MIEFITDYLARRRWAHQRACYQYGRRFPPGISWLERRRNYERLFREYMRIARLLRHHAHQLD